MIDLASAIAALAPGAEWTIDDNDYSKLVWLSPDIPQPTCEEVTQKAEELAAERPLVETRMRRAAAYAAEADPLFFKAQRGEATLDEWMQKVAEVRERFPYPSV